MDLSKQLLEQLLYQARTIIIPVHMVETINKLTRIQRLLIQELGREPTAEETERMDGMTPEKSP